jgi:hypothetical protein
VFVFDGLNRPNRPRCRIPPFARLGYLFFLLRVSVFSIIVVALDLRARMPTAGYDSMEMELHLAIHDAAHALDQAARLVVLLP